MPARRRGHTLGSDRNITGVCLLGPREVELVSELREHLAEALQEYVKHSAAELRMSCDSGPDGRLRPVPPRMPYW